MDIHQTTKSQKPAILWEGENGDSKTYTYGDLFREVQKFANVLKSLGVEKGDRVTIYLPMVPELPIAMLACARIGAIHTVIFSGFSAASIKDRIDDSKSKIVITADGGFDTPKQYDIQELLTSKLIFGDLTFHSFSSVGEQVPSRSCSIFESFIAFCTRAWLVPSVSTPISSTAE